HTTAVDESQNAEAAGNELSNLENVRTGLGTWIRERCRGAHLKGNRCTLVSCEELLDLIFETRVSRAMLPHKLRSLSFRPFNRSVEDVLNLLPFLGSQGDTFAFCGRSRFHGKPLRYDSRHEKISSWSWAGILAELPARR